MRKQLANFFATVLQTVCGVLMNGQPANEILPGLWLGNRQASQDVNWLRANRIVTVFNCTKDIPFVSSVPYKYRVPVDDNLQADELRNLEHWSFEIVYKIAKERNQGHAILVHCAAGMQRSAAVVAMFLISQYRCTPEQAIAFIKSKRPIAFYGQANFGPSIHGFYESYIQMLVKSKAWEKFPRIPLPTDAITNT